MGHRFYQSENGGRIPVGLPGGFFIYEAEGDGRILYAENNVVEIFGCQTFEELLEYVGGTFKGMIHPEDLPKIENQLEAQNVYEQKRHDYVRYRIIAKDGTIKYIEDFGHLLHSDDGANFYYVFILDVNLNEDSNEIRHAFTEAQMLTASNGIDELTGLLNMAFFYSKVQTLLSSVDILRKDISFIHFDIPNFKLYNERNSYVSGDELLKRLGKTIQSVFPNEVISRFSDDHFVVYSLLPKNEVVDRVTKVYHKMLINKDINKKIKIKAGIFFMENQKVEVGLACDHARLACNSIKRRHDIFYCIYDDIIRDDLRRQQFVVDHIDDAIANDYLRVFYQPIVRLATDEICGYEALVRWIDPQDGMLSPGYFIETLEDFHLIHFVDEFVIKKVCQDYVKMLNDGEALVPISINISRQDFEVCDVFKMLDDYCRIYDVPRYMIDVEITESAFNDNTGLIREETKRIRSAGFEVWIDDFGSGYSSLNTIAEYEFDVLKLDMVFLKNSEINPKTKPLMKSIIQTTKELGVSPLCEGVETQENYNFLKEIGCDRAQGYFIGKPMPLNDLLDEMYAKGMQWEYYSYN